MTTPPTPERAESRGSKTRFLFFAGVLVTLTAVVAVLLFVVPSAQKPDSNFVKLSEGDREAVRTVASTFVQDSNSWGFQDAALAEGAVWGFWDSLAYGGDSDLFTSRRESYLSYRGKLLSPEGPLWWSNEEVEQWKHSLTADMIPSFRVTSLEVKVPEGGTRYTLSGERTVAVPVEVSYEVEARFLEATSEENGWQGTFIVERKVFENTSVVSVVKAPLGWVVLSQSGDYSLLTTSANPREPARWDHSGLEVVEKITGRK